MSPLTIDRIKKANGQVRVVPTHNSDLSETDKNSYSVQILENGVWTNVFVGNNRQICEQIVRKATSQVILG